MNRKTNVLSQGILKFKQALKSISKERWLVIINILILIIMGIIHSLEAGHYVNFWPINGTFQDYNPIRRFLNGQIPYKDFQDYLGLGHLYLGTIFTGIMGGKYRASLIAFRLVAFLSTALIFYVVCRIILKKSSIALSITNLLLVILLIRPTFFETIVGDPNIKSALDYAMSTGNSARMLRGAILPISAFLVLKYGNTVVEFIKKRNYKIGNIYVISITAGCMAGFCLQWSNDYGISSWVCLLLMIFFVALSRTRKILKSFLCLFAATFSSVLSCVIIVEIVTFGNFTNWFFSAFGTGGYQTWYYIGPKSYYITDVDFSYIMLIQVFLGLFYLVKVWKTHAEGEAIIRYGLLAYINLTCFCAVNEYKLLSGGSSREVALVVLFVTIIAEIINYIGNTSLRKKAIYITGTSSLVVCIAWIIAMCQSEFKFAVFDKKAGIYVEEMGGYMTSLGEDILKTAEFLGDKKTFATYASAQELVSGHYQPSGTDYLIHVLGDKQRENYLKSFENDDFDYAVTINETLTEWEYWLQRANWFFYESLFANWHPVYANSYEIYWERNSLNDNDSIYTNNITVRVEAVDPTNSRALKVIVETDEEISGTADVYIDYETNKDGGKTALLMFTSMVNEVNTGVLMDDFGDYCERTNIRSSSKEYIPVTVVDGYGEVTLTSQPEKSTYLTINDVQCTQIYTVQFEYAYVDKIEEIESGYALHVVGSKRTNEILEDISYIYIDDMKTPIREISDGYIYINLSDVEGLNIDNGYLKTKNMFKVE